MLACLDAGATILGGCCGTSPDYIRNLSAALAGKRPAARHFRGGAFVCTPSVPLPLRGVRIIGERINPTGKKRFQQALLEDDLDYILDVAIQQEDAGADILDVNVGYPGVDEVSMLPRVVKEAAERRHAAAAAGLLRPRRAGGGTPGLQRQGGRQLRERGSGGAGAHTAHCEKIRRVRGGADPGQKRHPADGGGARTAIARRILDAALEHGISRDDLWIDCLTLTVSAQQEQAAETLKAVSAVRREMGLQTVLGVSNISFGLPNRALVTQSFLDQALYAGLTLPIVNPNQKEMMDAVAAFRVLSGEDAGCRAYVERFAGSAQIKPAAAPSEYTLEDAVIRGLRAEAGKLAKAALETEDELSVVENRLIPALDAVGGAYERGEAFLPQLLSAAQAAQAVFEVIRASMAGKGGAPVKKGRIAVATVQGDIHDIGKNIVKTVLENYGYELIDLGRDVPPEAVVQAVKERDARLVGLSALMTTTLPAMEETVACSERCRIRRRPWWAARW
jgi:5-methyltetrahydrofolate--homocysteine methyltransferase